MIRGGEIGMFAFLYIQNVNQRAVGRIGSFCYLKVYERDKKVNQRTVKKRESARGNV